MPINSLLDSDFLIAELAAEIKQCSLDECRDPEYTKRIKDRISAFCLEKGASDVRFTEASASERRHEFMVDLCAFEGQRMILAVESEWLPEPENTFYDFRKLLYLKAPLKVMICDSPSFVRDRLKPAAAFLAQYPDHLAGEEYIIFNFRGNRGVLNCHRWKPARDGAARLEEIRFSVVPGFPKTINEATWQKNHNRDDAWLPET